MGYANKYVFSRVELDHFSSTLNSFIPVVRDALSRKRVEGLSGHSATVDIQEHRAGAHMRPKLFKQALAAQEA